MTGAMHEATDLGAELLFEIGRPSRRQLPWIRRQALDQTIGRQHLEFPIVAPLTSVCATDSSVSNRWNASSKSPPPTTTPWFLQHDAVRAVAKASAIFRPSCSLPVHA